MKPLVPETQKAAQPAEMAAVAPGIDRLPNEVWQKILADFSQKDLRVLFPLSKRCRALAYFAGLYIHRYIYWNDIDGFDEGVSKLDELLEYAIKENTDINLALSVTFDFLSSGWEPGFYSDLGTAFHIVHRALPFLVGLSLRIPVPAQYPLLDLLRAHRAPRLGELVLDHCLQSVVPIPHDLFDGETPQLRRVSLRLMGQSAQGAVLQPVTVFERVTELRLSLTRTDHDFALSAMFPAVRELSVCVDGDAAARVDITGLRLRYLALNAGPGLLVPCPELASIPLIEHIQHSLLTLWPADRSELCMRAERTAHPNIDVSFASRAGSWRRSFRMSEATPDAPLPLADVPFLSTTLVSVTLDKALVNAFVQAPLTLDALRDFALDLSTGGASVSSPA
ncbi:hypothetical protein AURDEDRAFT_172324, partial [Auricularia subglabra TFB-10046 SS5]